MIYRAVYANILGFLIGIFLALIFFSISQGQEINRNNCIYILQKLTPKQEINILQNTTINAYITAQKDIVGKTTLTSPIHAGIKINIPLLDKKEQLQVLKENLRNLQYAYKTLNQYLTLKAKVEEQKKYLKWQLKRVEAGIEYKKDIWKEEIKYKQDLAHLKTLEIYFQTLGISRKILESCYKHILSY